MSGQISMESEGSEYSKLCLVPYWRQEDLEDIEKMRGMQETTVAARSFESGGILRDFLSDGFSTVQVAVRSIESYDDMEYLLTNFKATIDTPINRIRMRGVQDRTNADHYADVWKWVSCVTSRRALSHMARYMNPNYFEKLKNIAKGMNDERLEDVAFEGYFHALVSNRRSIQVECRKYDNVDRSTDPNWKNIMEQTDVIDRLQAAFFEQS